MTLPPHLLHRKKDLIVYRAALSSVQCVCRECVSEIRAEAAKAATSVYRVHRSSLSIDQVLNQGPEPASEPGPQPGPQPRPEPASEPGPQPGPEPGPEPRP